MTMRPAHRRRVLILALTAACAACALQETIPVKPPPAVGEPSGAIKEAVKGPAYAAPQLALGGEGQVYLLWHAMEQGKSMDALFARSVDLGATWSEPPISIKPVNAAGAAGRQIATGRNGVVYALWREVDPKTKIPQILFARSQDHGRHWDEPPRVVSASDDVGIPTLVADQGGGVYVASLVGPKSHRALEVVSSHDFGATFPSTPSRLTAAFPTSNHGITNHRVASDGKGHLYAVWEENKGGLDHRIYLNRSLDQGKTWGPQPILVSTPEGAERLASTPQILAGPTGQVYVAWDQNEFRPYNPAQPGAQREVDRFIHVNRSLDDGQTWLPQPIRLNPSEAGQGPVQSLMAQLSAGRHGRVYAVWIEAEGADRERLLVARSTDSGMTWSAPRALSNLFKGRLSYPEIRSDDEGHVWVLWQEIRPNRKEWRLLMNRSEDHGASWREQATALTKSAQRGGKFRSVSFVSDRHGRLYVAWDGGLWNTRELYVNRSTDFGATWLSREVPIGRR